MQQRETETVAAAEQLKNENPNQSMEVNAVEFGNSNTEFWDRIGEADFHQLMMMMDFAADSSDSATGNTLSS